MPGKCQVALGRDASGAIYSRARRISEELRERRRVHSRGPQHRPRANAILAVVDHDVDAEGIDADDPCFHPDLHAELSELALRVVREVVTERGERLLTRIDEHHAYSR